MAQSLPQPAEVVFPLPTKEKYPRTGWSAEACPERTGRADESLRRSEAGARRSPLGDRRCARRPRPTRAVHGRTRHREDTARRRILAPRHGEGDARAVGTMLGRRRRSCPLATWIQVIREVVADSDAPLRPLAQPSRGDRPDPAGTIVGGTQARGARRRRAGALSDLRRCRHAAPGSGAESIRS